MDVYWGEGFLGQGEWNYHGTRGSGMMFRKDGLEVLGTGGISLYGMEGYLFIYYFIFLAVGLCFGLKNVAVLKSPNSEPESIYLAT
jgi:hypothetical protein